MKNIVIFGGKGNGAVVASNIEQINLSSKKKKYKILGFINDGKEKKINSYNVLGNLNIETIKKYLKKKNTYFFWSLISSSLRLNSVKRLKNLKIPQDRFETFIHPSAIISKDVKIGYGVNISSFVNISPNVTINNHVNIFSQCMIGHDTSISNYTYVSNNAVIGAKIKICEGVFIGMNSTIRENVILKPWSVVGMGSVVLKNVRKNETVIGNPAKAK